MKKAIHLLSLFFLLQLTVLSSFSYAQVWAWAKSAVGPQKVESYAIATDKTGNSYITGWFEDSISFGSITLHAVITNNDFASDIFIAKYDINGNFVWAKRAGGENYDYGNGITCDTAGNIYVVGLFSLTATFGTHTVTSSGDYDVFVAKYDPNGTCLWVNSGGGTGWDVGSGVNIDKLGNCYITGAFRNTATFGTSSPMTSAGNYDIFVAKYDNTGAFLWVRNSGGPGDDRGISISSDGASNCYVTGFFNGTINLGTSNLTSAGSSDILLAKYDAIGNAVWAKRAGGTFADEGKAIISDSAGTTHITGFFSGNSLFGGGLDTLTLSSYGGEDIFVGKYDYKGDLVWVKKEGGVHDDIGYAITTDTAGNSYVAGSFFIAAQFDTIPMTGGYQDDAFVAGFDYYGKAKWVVKGGGVNPDVARGVTVSKLGSCYTTGYFSTAATFGTHPITGVSDNDLFIAKIDSAFIVNIPNTGINENAIYMKDIVVYPNPSNMDVTFQFETNVADVRVGIELYDILGKEVTDKVVVKEIKSFSNKKQIIINRGNLPDGVYLGKIIVGNKIYSVRLMLINP